MDVAPRNYTLVFEPDLKKFVFKGTETITIECKKPTDTITMHCAEIAIKSCSVHARKEIACTIKTDDKTEELQINLAKKIRGKAKIHLIFWGTLNDRLLGFYRSRYGSPSRPKYLATTQFEAADARRAFPCWDEPDAKATFEISIITNDTFDAISNMPVQYKRKSNGKTIHKFEKTPVMSTYLVYLGIGEFEYLQGKTGKTTIRIVTTKGNKSKGKFALDLGKKLLCAYEKYFGIKYPLPKLDLVAIPDFAAGAMENWGAITFRETILLYDPQTSSTNTKQFIAEVISHEIAHQWFGNLVTMKWWNDLWLNESFATFMATKFVDMFYPEWEMWSQFIETDMNAAMNLDSLKTTHPIDVKVDSPAEIREIFDAISYDKGGCVLRMLEHFVGEASFRKGLKKYLRDFQYSNATGRDLWNAIGRESGLPVKSMVESWLTQPGFPLVEATRNGNKLLLKQSRYLLESGKKNGLWRIPLSIHHGTITKKIFSTKSSTIKLPPDADHIVNYGRHGFYRVQYDTKTISNLKKSIDSSSIPAIDRWAIQNDLYSLCLSRREKIQTYLDFTDAYYNDGSYIASMDVASNLASLYFRVFGQPFSKKIQSKSSRYFRHLLDNLGWEPQKTDKHTDALLRAYVISTLGRMDDADVAARASKLYVSFLRSPRSLCPDLIGAVCTVAAWNGGRTIHSQLTNLYKKAATAEEKLRFLGAMCGFRDETLLKKTLSFSLTSDVRSQDVHLPITRVAANPHGKKILWPWLVKNWRTLDGIVGHGNPLFNRIVASISHVADHTMEEEIRRFFQKNPTPGTERTQTQVLERIRINSAFLESMQREFSDG